MAKKNRTKDAKRISKRAKKHVEHRRERSRDRTQAGAKKPITKTGCRNGEKRIADLRDPRWI